MPITNRIRDDEQRRLDFDFGRTKYLRFLIAAAATVLEVEESNLQRNLGR
jgi:hypothetical protein